MLETGNRRSCSLQGSSRQVHPGFKYIFCDIDLGNEMYEKLIEGVEKALKFQLTQVDEDSCEEEYDSAE